MMATPQSPNPAMRQFFSVTDLVALIPTPKSLFTPPEVMEQPSIIMELAELTPSIHIPFPISAQFLTRTLCPLRAIGSCVFRTVQFSSEIKPAEALGDITPIPRYKPSITQCFNVALPLRVLLTAISLP